MEPNSIIESRLFNEARQTIGKYFELGGNRRAISDWSAQGTIYDLEVLRAHGLLEETQATKLKEAGLADESSAERGGKLKSLLEKLNAVNLKGIKSKEFLDLSGEINQELMRDNALANVREHYTSRHGRGERIVKKYLEKGAGGN